MLVWGHAALMAGELLNVLFPVGMNQGSFAALRINLRPHICRLAFLFEIVNDLI